MTAAPLFFAIAGWILVAMAALGSLYTLVAAIVVGRFFALRSPAPRRNDAVTLLKPLHGAEPRLLDNLSTFLALDHDGPVQLLLGVQRRDDPAIAVVDALRTRFPAAHIDLVIDTRIHGANGKIGNLINMAPHIAHPLLVLSDSDIAVEPDYLAQILAALGAPGTGAVTCLYRGRGDAGFWSCFGAAGLDWHMLPDMVFGISTGMATPCMGSTIALKAETLAMIGGLERFADTLADDYAIGQAIVAQGLHLAVPPMLVTHASADASLAALWRHEVRWGATIFGVERAGYAAAVIAMPLPLALLAMPFHPVYGAVAVVAAWAVRTILALVIGRVTNSSPISLALLPARDCFTFAGFIASFFSTSVDWRGSRLKMKRDGRIAADPEISA
ncbi:MAG: bacteriohopanetetrol glucosamine biosynthesis glycosyltransferase HpnI [Pseudomonadota bacterium]|nr:bacteriohopanetetrol glucosamine biosynthesis glycosyltransferase HpnI [Pseudomonadota bacterium]